MAEKNSSNQFFKQIPNNLFVVFSSDNKVVYIESLFAIEELFSSTLFRVTRKQVTDIIQSVLISLHSTNIKASEIVNNLKQWGWINFESDENNMSDDVILPEYAYKLITVIKEIAQNKPKESKDHINSQAYQKFFKTLAFM